MWRHCSGNSEVFYFKGVLTKTIVREDQFDCACVSQCVLYYEKRTVQRNVNEVLIKTR